MVDMRSLRTGEQFTFPGVPRSFYVNRGNGWFDGGRGYQGGPWHRPEGTMVIPVDTISDQWQEHLERIGYEK
jgi:hypothetical protein